VPQLSGLDKFVIHRAPSSYNPHNVPLVLMMALGKNRIS